MSNKCLIIQPGALGDCLLTVPLVRMLAGIGTVDVMGHAQRLAILAGRTQVRNILSLEQPGLHTLFAQGFEASQHNRPLGQLLGDYPLIVTFLADHMGLFQQNLQRLAGDESAAKTITVELRPPPDWPGHAAEFFIKQVCLQLPNHDFSDDHDLFKAPLLQVTEADQRRGRELLAQHNIPAVRADVIAIHPGSGSRQKYWPWENFRQVVAALQGQGFAVVMLLGPTELDRWPSEIVAAIQAKLPVICNAPIGDVAAVLRCCAAYLGNDSGITHLAAALDLPGLAVFGPSNMVHWRPLSTRMHALCGPEGSWPTVDDVLTELTASLLSEKT